MGAKQSIDDQSGATPDRSLARAFGSEAHDCRGGFGWRPREGAGRYGPSLPLGL